MRGGTGRFRLRHGHTTTTRPCCTRSWSSCWRTSASPPTRRRCLPLRASRSRPCRSCSPRSTSSGRACVCLFPEDADARDAAEGARWFLGDERVALLPSRGVHWGSGLEPPPHLVGERARALDVLAAGGLVCASAAAVAEAMPPRQARPEPLALEPGAAPGLDARRGAPRPRRLRAGRPRPGARPLRRARRARRRVPDHRPRPGQDRALRRRDRGDPRLLPVHPASAARRGERRRLPGRGAPARPAGAAC